ncbi:MAG: bacteriohemerythrin [Porticoccus sp.]
MEKITWLPSYEVGFPKIDGQHQKIISIINKLIDGSAAITVDSEVLSELLSELTGYADEHFSTEEDFFVACEYLGASDHRQEHKRYRLKIASLCQDVMYHKENAPVELLKFLSTWWVEHILKEDLEFKKFAGIQNKACR